jgi:hypothetical protein
MDDIQAARDMFCGDRTPQPTIYDLPHKCKCGCFAHLFYPGWLDVGYLKFPCSKCGEQIRSYALGHPFEMPEGWEWEKADDKEREKTCIIMNLLKARDDAYMSGDKELANEIEGAIQKIEKGEEK